MDYYKNKYLKYKRKYLDEIKKLGGSLKIIPEVEIDLKPISSLSKEEKSKQIYNTMNKEMNDLIENIIKNKNDDNKLKGIRPEIARLRAETEQVIKINLYKNYKNKYRERINDLMTKAIHILNTIDKCSNINDEINEDNKFFLVNDNGDLKPVTIKQEDRDKYYIFSCQMKDI